jgi:hypothetical protein
MRGLDREHHVVLRDGGVRIAGSERGSAGCQRRFDCRCGTRDQLFAERFRRRVALGGPGEILREERVVTGFGQLLVLRPVLRRPRRNVQARELVCQRQQPREQIARLRLKRGALLWRQHAPCRRCRRLLRCRRRHHMLFLGTLGKPIERRDRCNGQAHAAEHGQRQPGDARRRSRLHRPGAAQARADRDDRFIVLRDVRFHKVNRA